MGLARSVCDVGKSLPSKNSIYRDFCRIFLEFSLYSFHSCDHKHKWMSTRNVNSVEPMRLLSAHYIHVTCSMMKLAPFTVYLFFSSRYYAIWTTTKWFNLPSQCDSTTSANSAKCIDPTADWVRRPLQMDYFLCILQWDCACTPARFLCGNSPRTGWCFAPSEFRLYFDNDVALLPAAASAWLSTTIEATHW